MATHAAWPAHEAAAVLAATATFAGGVGAGSERERDAEGTSLFSALGGLGAGDVARQVVGGGHPTSTQGAMPKGTAAGGRSARLTGSGTALIRKPRLKSSA